MNDFIKGLIIGCTVSCIVMFVGAYQGAVECERLHQESINEALERVSIRIPYPNKEDNNQ
jgi:hypothetical protein